MTQRKGGKLHVPVIVAKYDAASRSPEAMRHWRGADELSADAALLPGIRKLIVSRARYEVGNNGYAEGILSTLADDAIGTGPRLQLYFSDLEDLDEVEADQEMDKQLRRREIRWKRYCREIRLASKLRLARLAKARDGEVFILKSINPKFRGHVKIDLTLYETEQVGSALATDLGDYYKTGVPKEVDGILYDRFGNPERYRFWTVHPGAYDGAGLMSESYFVPARAVIHYANFVRPGQHRGIPEIASTLPIFNDLRRYTNAVLAAAETAAEISFLLETDALPDPDEYELDRDPESGKLIKPINFTDVIQLAKNSGLALPEGWKGHQLKAEQPTSTYGEFVNAKLNEAARPLSMPFNIAKGNSSGYNYASGRLDHQTYNKKIRIERSLIEETILDDLLASFEEIDRLHYPEDYERDDEIDHGWMWDGFEHVDPVKEANAQDTRLANHTTTLQDECAKEGKDYTAVLRQRARECRLARKLNLPDQKQNQAQKPKENNDEEENEN